MTTEIAIPSSLPQHSGIDRDVFISYARKDQAFVERLFTALKANGRSAWVDWADIPHTADWWEEIERGIEGANTFIFILSANSVKSEVCTKEINYAVQHRKRLVPVLLRQDFDANKEAHPELNRHNWLFFRDTDDFDKALQSLLKAIDTDLNHVRLHTRLLVKALEWDRRGRDDSFLLRKSDLAEAEQWCAKRELKEPAPTPLQQEYIAASSKAEVEYNERLAKGDRALRRIKQAAFVILAAVLAVIGAAAFAEHSRRKAAMAERNMRDVWKLNQAHTELMSGKTDKALGILSQAVQANPQNTFVLNQRGVIYAWQGKHSEAERDYREALKLDPRDVFAWNGLGIVLHNQKKFEAAIEAYNQGIELEPTEPAFYYNRGNSQRALGRPQQALTDYSYSLQLKNPEPWVVYATRGNVRLALKDRKGALEDYNQALQLKPDYSLAYYYRGNLLLEDGERESAITDYNNALNYGHPEPWQVLVSLGDALSAQGDEEEAKQAYWRVIQGTQEGRYWGDSEYRGAYAGLGKLQFRLKDYQGALKTFDKLVQLYEQANEKAVGDSEQTSQLKTNLAMAYFNLGQTRFQLEAYRSAITDYTKAIELKPTELWLVLTSRGDARYADGDNISAAMDYREALKLQPDYVPAQHGLVSVLIRQKKLPEAIAISNELIQNNPRDAMAYANRGNAYYLQNQNKLALADLNQASRLSPNLAEVRELHEKLYPKLRQASRR